MQARTHWTHSDVWLQLAKKPESSFKLGDRQSKKKQWHRNLRAICNSTRGFDAGHGVIRHQGVYDNSERVRPLWRSHSAWTKMCFAHGIVIFTTIIIYRQDLE